MNNRKTENLRTLIVGIGSAHGDDQAGWLVAEQLHEFASENQFELKLAKSPADLLDWIEDIDRMAICDACHGLGQIGKLCRWTWPTSEISEFSMSGTHNLALATVLALAEKLGRLPNEVVIWAIEGAKGRSNTTVSFEVTGAVATLVDRIASELNATPSYEANACTNIASQRPIETS